MIGDDYQSKKQLLLRVSVAEEAVGKLKAQLKMVLQQAQALQQGTIQLASVLIALEDLVLGDEAWVPEEVLEGLYTKHPAAKEFRDAVRDLQTAKAAAVQAMAEGRTDTDTDAAAAAAAAHLAKRGGGQ